MGEVAWRQQVRPGDEATRRPLSERGAPPCWRAAPARRNRRRAHAARRRASRAAEAALDGRAETRARGWPPDAARSARAPRASRSTDAGVRPAARPPRARAYSSSPGVSSRAQRGLVAAAHELSLAPAREGRRAPEDPGEERGEEHVTVDTYTGARSPAAAAVFQMACRAEAAASATEREAACASSACGYATLVQPRYRTIAVNSAA
jgi:hypothetical protein